MHIYCWSTDGSMQLNAFLLLHGPLKKVTGYFTASIALFYCKLLYYYLFSVELILVSNIFYDSVSIICFVFGVICLESALGFILSGSYSLGISSTPYYTSTLLHTLKKFLKLHFVSLLLFVSFWSSFLELYFNVSLCVGVSLCPLSPVWPL